MSAVPVIRCSANPMRDYAPLEGVDAEFQRFLRLSNERRAADRKVFSGRGYVRLPAAN